jgi:hypothetical protein
MERFNRMLQAAQGMGMGGAAPGAVSKPAAVFICKKPFSPAVLELDRASCFHRKK